MRDRGQSFLDGPPEPFIETRVRFNVDGLEIKARHDVAAKVIDWRTMYMGDGEAIPV